MILDHSETLSDRQAVTATALSENVLMWPANGTPIGDAAAITRDKGTSAHIPLLVQVVEDFAGLTTLTITAETADNAAMTSSTVLWSTGAVPVAQLKAGWQPSIQPMLPRKATGQYFALRYTVAGTNASAGRITAAVVLGVQTNG